METGMVLLLTGIFITSDEPITIHIAPILTSTGPGPYVGYTPDIVLARPVSSSAMEYFLVGYNTVSTAQAYPRLVI